MAQPSIPGTAVGIPRMLYASDGSNWYAILVDSDGHVKVDIVSAALPTDAATETTLALIKGYVDNLETLLAGGLPAALDTLALKVKEQSPLTGFATAANQTIIAGYIDALETLLAGGLPAALDSGALKTKEQSPLTGFATSTNQATMITALQLIDDLRAALGSVATDYLRVLRVAGSISTLRAAVDTLVKTGAAKIWWITIGAWGAVNSAVIVYDNTAASGTVKWVGRIPIGGGYHSLFDPPIECSTGIYVDVADATTEFTIGYS